MSRSIRSPRSPPANDPERLALLGRARSHAGGAPRLRGLPRLPHVRELLRARSPTCSRASIATSRSAGAKGAELLDDADFRSITDLCWQCKLCYIKCPYTADQKHEWLVDVPRLLMRDEGAARAAQRRDAAGPGARRAAAARRDDERARGADRELREREPPRAEGEREARSASRPSSPSRRSPEPSRSGSRATSRCPAPARAAPSRSSRRARATTTTRRPRDAVRVLEQNGFDGRPPRADVLRHPEPRRRRHRRRAGEGAVQRRSRSLARGRAPAARSSSSSRRALHDQEGVSRSPRHRGRAQGRREHARPDAAPRAAPARQDAQRDFQKGLGKVAYHAACHLRAQKIGFPGGARPRRAARHRGRGRSSSARPSTAPGG